MEKINHNRQAAIRRVLREAAQTSNFFDLSDAERLTWMLGRIYEIGQRQRNIHNTPKLRPAAKFGRRSNGTSSAKR
jgi:hypothetical protein